MAVTFASDTFLPAINPGENFLKIRDTSGSIRYKIYNNTVSSLFVNVDIVVLKTEADSKTLHLQFQTRTEAQTGLNMLQAALAKIKENFQTSKDSKFSDVSFELYDDVNRANFINFDLSTLNGNKVLQIGKGNVLQTEIEVNATLNDATRFRFFEHFLIPHKLVQGTFSGAIIKNRSNEIGNFGILEMTLNTSLQDAHLWSSINSFQLNDSCKFSTAFRVTTLSDVLDNYRIVIGFFNQNTITNVTKGAYFIYDYALNTSNWLVKATDSTSTIQNTLIPIDTNWHIFSTRFNALHELEFLIDNVIVSTIDTNVPTAYGSEVSFGILFEKIDATQTTSLLVDWIKFDIDF